MKSAETFELLSAIAALDRKGRQRGFLPLDPADGALGASKGAHTVRLKGRVSLGFATGDVFSVEEAPETGEAFSLSTQAYSLAGAMGPLPIPIAENLLARAARGDRAGLDFLDLFHGRLLQLFYLIRKRSRPALGATTGARTAQARMVRQLTHLPESQWLRHAGLQSGIPQSAASLRQILTERLQTPIRLAGLQGGWQPIRAAGSCSLADRPRLGVNATLGHRYWHTTIGLRIETPPVAAGQIQDWLPGGVRYVMLTELLTTVLQRTMTLLLVVHPEGHSVPHAQLSGDRGLRLGQNAWLKSRAETVRLPSVQLVLRGAQA